MIGGYAVLFWATVGQTPGMRLLGLSVAAPTEDRRAWPMLVRLAGTLLALAPLGAGFLPVLSDLCRRALQDFLAGTVVVRVPEPEA